MALAETFTEAVEALPEDWSRAGVDLRIFDERRYVEAALLLTTAGAQPYSESDWHWRINVANRFGHGAAVEAVTGALKMLDDSGIGGEMQILDVRSGRAPVTHGWGRPESVRREFRHVHRQ
ncbi:MAG TPA: hypothetical protein PKB03_09125 [Baekduia sp.]|nr:hypothetical protein [Baekduia sp.]